MQNTNKNKLFRYLGMFLKVLMLVLTFWFIYDRIFSTQNINEISDYFNSHLQIQGRIWMLILAIFLMLVNWGLETLKWRYLILKIENLSFLRAFKAVLSGVTVSVFTPNRIGEYAGRVVYINHGDRIVAALITVISSLSQLLVTLLVGAFCLLFYFEKYQTDVVGSLSIYIGIQLYVVLFVLSILTFINTSFLSILLSRIKFLADRFQKYIEVFSYYTQGDLLKVLGISLLRYSVFSVQYFLLLTFFDVGISLVEALILIPVYFITLTAIPTITLAELGVREVVAITVFAVISTNEIGMVSTSFAIWCINLAIPALIGVVFVLQARLFKTSK
ncbi:MAG: lysylphosphatidylglycerol synthase domain-containing protein [Salibacteraceae bacterium]